MYKINPSSSNKFIVYNKCIVLPDSKQANLKKRYAIVFLYFNDTFVMPFRFDQKTFRFCRG